MQRFFQILKRLTLLLIPNQILSIYYSRQVRKYNELSTGEKEFFSLIKDSLKSVVDVGARTDTFYASVYFNAGETCDVHMFEANPAFAKKLIEITPSLNKNSFVYNCAIGKEPGKLYYYYDSQSFILKSNMGNVSRYKSNSPIEVRTIDSFSEEIKQIDFLKTDIEEMDFYALLGAKNTLPKVHFIQFELGLGMSYLNRKVTNTDYWDLLETDFDLYVLRDEANPIWKANHSLPLLLRLTIDVKIVIEILQVTGVGFNIVGINKLKETPGSLKAFMGTLKAS
jgi:FkbM family methyltransferase